VAPRTEAPQGIPLVSASRTTMLRHFERTGPAHCSRNMVAQAAACQRCASDSDQWSARAARRDYDAMRLESRRQHVQVLRQQGIPIVVAHPTDGSPFGRIHALFRLCVRSLLMARCI
jgi:CRISPR/Cas system-associated exonuclease Cas4 (RecB family)